jgi:hypothetical protein
MTTKIIFDITLTIVIIYIFFIYNVEHNIDLPDEIQNVQLKYKNDINEIKYLYDIAKKIQIENEYLTVSQKQLIIGSGATGPTGATGDIRFADCFASGYISVGSAKITRDGDIYGNNLNLKGSIIAEANNIFTGGIIAEANNDKGDLIELINTQKKDDKWIISNTKSEDINDNKLSFTKKIGNTKDISVLELYDNGDVNIPGNLKVHRLVVNNIYKKRNKARYIRVGNKKSELAVPNYWSLKQIKVFDHNDINVAQGNSVIVTTNLGSPVVMSTYNNDPNNIVKDNMDGYYGGLGEHELQIDLVDEYDIYRIELYNINITNYQENLSRMNGTNVELISYDGQTINRKIHTGLWKSVFSKEYIL